MRPETVRPGSAARSCGGPLRDLALDPAAWQKAMQEISRYNPRVIRIGGIISMLAGAVLLQFLN